MNQQLQEFLNWLFSGHSVHVTFGVPRIGQGFPGGDATATWRIVTETKEIKIQKHNSKNTRKLVNLLAIYTL